MARKNIRGLGTLEQRGETWHMDVMVHGVRYRESTGTEKYNQAVNFLKRRISEIQQGKYAGPKAERTTMDTLLADVLANYESHGKNMKATRARIARLREWFGARRASAVTIPLLTKFRDERIAQGADPASVNRELAFVRRAFYLGRAAGNVMSVPNFKDSELFLPENAPRQGFFEHADYVRMRDALPVDERAVFIAGYWTVMRYETITSFVWDWVDLGAQCIRIPQGVTKNGEAVIVPTGGPGCEFYELLAQRLDLRNTLCPSSPWVFFRSENRNRQGKASRQIGKQVKCIRHYTDRLRVELGLDGKLFHDLRRTGARDMRRAGASEGVIMQLGGWKTPSVFRRYDIRDERDLHEAVAARNAKVAGAGK